MVVNQGPQSSMYNTPAQNTAQEAARKALSGEKPPTATEAAKTALGIPQSTTQPPTKSVTTRESRRGGGGGGSLPMSTPTNITPSAAPGQTMESVAAQSYSPQTDIHRSNQPIQFTNQQLQTQAQLVMQGSRNITMQSAIVPYEKVGKPGDFERGYGKEFTRLATPQERSRIEQIGPRVPGTNQYAFTRSGRGTLQTKPEVSIGEVRRFEIASIENKAQSIVQNTYKQEAQKLIPSFQEKVNSGELTEDKANKQLNEQATANTQASLQTNPVYAQTQRQYETTAKKYGVSQDIYGKTYFKDLEKTGIEKGREQTKESLQVVASLVPPLRPLLIGEAIKEQQKAPIIIEDINKVNLKNIENYPTRTSPEAQKLLLLGAGSSLLEAPLIIKGIGREINLARIEQLNKMPSLNVGLRKETAEGFTDVLFTKKVTPEARLDVGTLVNGRQISEGTIKSTSQTESALTYYDFLSGKPISIYQKQQGAALSKVFEQQGKSIPSVSTLRTRQTVDLVLKPKGKGYTAEFNIFTNKPFKTKVVGGVSQEKGNTILSISGDINAVINDIAKGRTGFNFKASDFTILRKVGTKPGRTFDLGGGISKSFTKSVSKPAPSLTQEINKLAQQETSERAIMQQTSKVNFGVSKSAAGLNTGEQELKLGTKTKTISSNINQQSLENLQSGEIKTKTISGLITSTSTDNFIKQSENQLTSLVTGTKIKSEQPLAFKQITKPSTTTTTSITPREITGIGGGIDLGFPFGFGGGGSGSKEESKKAIRKKRKISSKYTASLISAAFQQKPTKVTMKQLKRLNETIFTGAEARPILQLVPDDEQLRKLVKSVSF